MEVQTESLKEILGELFTLLEAQETHSVAILQFLKDQGIATDEKLAPYLEQAGKGQQRKMARRSHADGALADAHPKRNNRREQG
jgi:hypothetical protein